MYLRWCVYLPGYVMDDWWNHHGVINNEVRYSRGVCLPGCVLDGRITMVCLHIGNCPTEGLCILGVVFLAGCVMDGW